MRHRLGRAAATVVVAAAACGWPASDTARAQSACTASSGVTVVVDFSAFGQGIARGCAPGQPGTGLDALHAAGFGTAGTAQFGSAFVCRINGLPTPAADGCVGTPPADAYWAYYHANQGDASWRYSTVGAASYHPQVGSVEGWAFGARATPHVAPSQVQPPPATLPPTPPPTPPPTARVTPPPTPPPGAAATSPPPAPAPAPTPAPKPGSAAPTGASTSASVGGATSGAPTPLQSSASSPTSALSPSSAATAPTTTAITTSAVPAIAPAESAGTAVLRKVGVVPDPPTHQSGSPVGVIIGAVAVAALAIGGVAVVRSKRLRT